MPLKETEKETEQLNLGTLITPSNQAEFQLCSEKNTHTHLWTQKRFVHPEKCRNVESTFSRAPSVKSFSEAHLENHLSSPFSWLSLSQSPLGGSSGHLGVHLGTPGLEGGVPHTH